MPDRTPAATLPYQSLTISTTTKDLKAWELLLRFPGRSPLIWLILKISFFPDTIPGESL
jgi:hypothetical protein